MLIRRLAILALVALVSCRGPDRTTTPPVKTATVTESGPTKVLTDADQVLPLWPAVRKGTLPNGLTFYIMKHGKPEGRASLWLAVNAGSVQEDDDQRGLAHFVEHMAFNGTVRFPKAEIVNYLERIGMRFGPDLNAYTSFDETVYQLEVPTDKPEFVAKGLDILRDWAGGVAFDAAEIDKERGVVLEEWRLGRGAQQRIFDEQSKVLFQGTRYAERLPIGQPEILKKATRDVFIRFYQDWYRPDLMAIIAVGDVDPDAMEKEIRARFGDLENPTTPRPRPSGGVPKAGGTRVSVVTDKEMPASIVAIYNVYPHRGESTVGDFRRFIAEQLYGHIINERLGALARRKDAPFAAAAVGVQSITREVDVFGRFAQVKGPHTEATVAALFTEVLRVEKHGFTEGELERARKVLARAYEQMDAEHATSSSRDHADEITRNFFEGELMIGRRAEKDYALAFLPQITVAEMNALARSFGGADNRVILISAPEGKKLPDRKRLLAIVDEVEKQPIEPWEDEATKATVLMATPPAAPGKIVKENVIESLGVTEWTLSNGARVIVKPTDFEADSVQLEGTSPGGLAMASDKEYNDARFADDVARIGGAGGLDDQDLERVLAGKRVSVSATIGDTTESVDASASVRDLETMFQLVHLRMTAPRKDPDAFAVWQENLVEQLQDRLNDPQTRYAIASQEALFRNHPRRKPPTPDDAKRLDQDKALAFYAERFGDATDFTFVIVGAVDLAKLRPLVETYLASLPAKGRREKEKDAGIRRVGGVVKKSWALGKEPKARVHLLFHGKQRWTRDDERDMFILGQVLDIRLREILREDMGGVYGVDAGGSLTRSPPQERAFWIDFGCAPEAVDALVKAALAEAAAVAKNGASEEVLAKIRETYLRQRETAMRTNGFWVGWLTSAYRFGEDPTIILDPGPMQARMAPRHVAAAARRYLDGKQMYQAVLLPAPPEPAK